MRAKNNLARPAAAAFGIAALFGVGQAFAADAIVEQPPAPSPLPVEQVPVASWAGPYAGIQLGYGFSGKDEGDVGDIDTDGFVGGGFAGWQGQSGMLVYGVEGDVGYNGMDGEDRGFSSEKGIDGSLRARIGMAVSDNVLIYGTAGGAATRMEVKDPIMSDTNTMLGYTVGAGTDIKLTEQVFARGEYRYTDYGSEDFNTSLGTQSFDSKENKVLFGVGMRF
ncbi:outer membrane protein [Mesorhizobium xinjiangense]|uniref:outer membrane protein n=1 Tax=Mesorhizobium xinjiangense TaxID=2678685 RepID=UPI0012EDAE0B|nr:outer membrane protein [Mesorhizobium xinjiangense]